MSVPRHTKAYGDNGGKGGNSDQDEYRKFSAFLKAIERKQVASVDPAYQEDIKRTARWLVDILKTAPRNHPSPPLGKQPVEGPSLSDIAIQEAFWETPTAQERLHGIVRAILIPRMHYIKPLLCEASALVNEDTRLADRDLDLVFRLKSQLLWLNEQFAYESTLEQQHPELLLAVPVAHWDQHHPLHPK